MRDFNARWVAYQILSKLEARKSNSTILLQETLVRVADPKDRNLITDLVLGTVRWRSRLLFLIAEFSKRPLQQLDKEVVLILQLGIYQLLYTNIAHHAAIFETVKLTKIARLTSASSFVNGILRGIQGRMMSLPEPSENVLATRWSHPQWLVNRWVERFGESDAVALMQVNNQPPPVYLHVNTLRVTPDTVIQNLLSEDISVDTTAFGPSVLRVREGAAQGTKSFLDGEFYIQDAAVHLLGDFIKPDPGATILEIAAAPGGKTIQLALRANSGGQAEPIEKFRRSAEFQSAKIRELDNPFAGKDAHAPSMRAVSSNSSTGLASIIAVDSDLRRMRTWQRNMQRMKIPGVHALLADARNLPLDQQFDQVIIDAPCSTLGVIRRHPEVKWWRQGSDLPALATLQLQILRACAKYVRSQGELIYSVCSFEPEETEQVREAFLNEQRDFSKLQEMTLLPHRDHTDGFYIVKMKAK